MLYYPRIIEPLRILSQPPLLSNKKNTQLTQFKHETHFSVQMEERALTVYQEPSSVETFVAKPNGTLYQISSEWMTFINAENGIRTIYRIIPFIDSISVFLACSNQVDEDRIHIKCLGQFWDHTAIDQATDEQYDNIEIELLQTDTVQYRISKMICVEVTLVDGTTIQERFRENILLSNIELWLESSCGIPCQTMQLYTADKEVDPSERLSAYTSERASASFALLQNSVSAMVYFTFCDSQFSLNESEFGSKSVKEFTDDIDRVLRDEQLIQQFPSIQSMKVNLSLLEYTLEVSDDNGNSSWTRIPNEDILDGSMFDLYRPDIKSERVDIYVEPEGLEIYTNMLPLSDELEGIVYFYSTGDIVGVYKEVVEDTVWHLDTCRICHKHNEGRTWIWLLKRR